MRGSTRWRSERAFPQPSVMRIASFTAPRSGTTGPGRTSYPSSDAIPATVGPSLLPSRINPPRRQSEGGPPTPTCARARLP